MIRECITAGICFQLVAASASRALLGYKEHKKYCLLPGRAFCSFIHLILFAGCVINKAGGVRACGFNSYICRQVYTLHRTQLLCTSRRLPAKQPLIDHCEDECSGSSAQHLNQVFFHFPPNPSTGSVITLWLKQEISLCHCTRLYQEGFLSRFKLLNGKISFTQITKMTNMQEF